MRYILKSSLLVGSVMLAAPTLANANGFESTIMAPVASDVKIEIRLSDDLAYRANNLPEKLSDRGNSAGRSSAFSQNGFYGERDLIRLQERLEKRLTRQLGKRGLTVSDSAPTVLRVTLADVKNNRPTFRQLSRSTGLSYQSFGTGGAELEAEVLSAGGSSLGTMRYEWYEFDVRDSQFGGTWTDAHRAMDRFAIKAAKKLSRGAQS